jgi:hypothetical protein
VGLAPTGKRRLVTARETVCVCSRSMTYGIQSKIWPIWAGPLCPTSPDTVGSADRARSRGIGDTMRRRRYREWRERRGSATGRNRTRAARKTPASAVQKFNTFHKAPRSVLIDISTLAVHQLVDQADTKGGRRCGSSWHADARSIHWIRHCT